MLATLAMKLLRFADVAFDYVNGVDRSAWRGSTVTAGDIAMLRQTMVVLRRRRDGRDSRLRNGSDFRRANTLARLARPPRLTLLDP